MELLKSDIQSEEDIKKFVDTFYDKVNKDAVLGPVFNTEAKVDWEHHLPKMYKFWGTQLIGTSNYLGRPFPPHTLLNIGKDHFNRWIELFMNTVDELFEGPVAEMAKHKAFNIATIFQIKLGIINMEEMQ